jgi:hypothetical protein
LGLTRPKERQAALNAMLKPLVDRVVAPASSAPSARQAALRSDEAAKKLASAQIEGGYRLAPFEYAANHWAFEPAGFQLTAYEAAVRPWGRTGVRVR